MTKIVRPGYVMAVAMALVLLASIACAKAEEKPVAPAPTAKAAPAPTATTAPVPTAKAVPAPTATTVPAPAVVRPTHWTWAVAEDPTVNFDPLNAAGGSGALRAQNLLFDRFFDYVGPKLEPAGYATESWEFSTPTTLRFHVRKNVKFHNGATLTGEDIYYSLDNNAKAEKLWYGAAFGSEIKSVELTDPSTVQINFKRQFGPVVSYLLYMRAMPKAYREQVGAEVFSKKPVGTGPYKLDSVTEGQKTDFVASTEYWLGPVFPPKLTIFWIRDATTRAAGLFAGTVDAIASVPYEEAPRIEKNVALKLIRVGDSKARWHVNYGDPPFNNENLRKAVNHALDKEAIAKGLLEGRGAVMAGAFIKGNYGFDPNLKPYPYDPAKAKSLIKEAGLEGTSFEFFSLSGTFPKDREVGQFAAAAWEAVGLKPQLKYITREQVWDSRDRRTFQISNCCSWGDNKDMDAEVNWDYLDVGQRADRPLYKDTPLAAELYKMWDEQRGYVDDAKRDQVFRQIGQFVYDHALSVFTHSRFEYIAMKQDLGWSPYSNGNYVSSYKLYDHWGTLRQTPPK